MKNKIIKYQVLIIFLSIILGILFGYIAFSGTDAITEKKMNEKIIPVMDKISIEAGDYQITDGTFFQTDKEIKPFYPVFYISIPEEIGNINSLALVIDDYKTDNYIANDKLMGRMLTSEKKDGQYTKADFIVEYANDENIIIFNVSDIDLTKAGFSIRGNFRLREVLVSEFEPEIIREKIRFNLRYTIIPIILLLILFEIFFFSRQILFSILKKIAERKKYYLLCLLLKTAGGLTGLCIGKLLNQENYNYFTQVWFISLGTLIPLLILGIKKFIAKPELLFALISLFVGITFIFEMPSSGFVTWDDQVHYRDALALSYGGHGIMTAADDDVIDLRSLPLSDYADSEIMMSNEEYMNMLYESGPVYIDTDSHFKLTHISYMPAAMGLFTGRLLHLNFSGTFVLGRLFVLLTYTGLVYMAIRSLRYGKMFLACIALMPTLLFQACNISYDSWITGFFLLGTALFISELQTDTYITVKKEIYIILAFLAGLIPKPVYFPILLILFAMPKNKFKHVRKMHDWIIYEE